MRFTLDLLGHHIEFSVDHPSDEAEAEREGSADALVERADPWSPPLGFGPHQPREQARP